MKVKELIEALQAYDGELEVFTYAEDDEDDSFAIELIREVKESDLDFHGVLLS